MQNDITILVHGFFRTRSDMRYLEAGLKAMGRQVLSVQLPTFFSSLDQCCDALAAQVDPIAATAKTVHYVAHSMGGLIVRAYIARTQQQNVGHSVLIATPHRGSKLAAIAKRIPFYATIFKPINDLLPSLHYHDFGTDKAFKLGVIAGNRNQGLIGKLLMPADSDGRVTVASAQAIDMDDFIVLPYGHDTIHHTKQTLELVQHCLSTGRFDNA